MGWTIALYFSFWALALALADTMFLLSVLLTIVLGLFNVRIFNIQHDCTHHSYFSSHAANDRLGLFLGIMTLTPHFYWTRNHLRHHGTSGNLDRRGAGDIYVYTLREFRNLPWWRKLFYVLYRNPLVYLLIGPIYHFMLKMRIPHIAKRGSKERYSIHFVNVALVLILAPLLVWYPHPGKFVVLYAMSFLIGASIGLWLFYVQHQFEGVYWKRTTDWNFSESALHGSSYLWLPRFIEWFFVYINLHHIHHMYPKTPNYHLKRRMAEFDPTMKPNGRMTLWDAVRAFQLKLWDEDAKEMVGFAAARRRGT